MTRIWLPLLICFACAPQLARAQGQEAEARLYYEQGEQLFQQRQWSKARELFHRSYGLVPVAGLAYNIAKCYELEAHGHADDPSARQGRLADSYNWYETFVVVFGLEGQRRQKGISARDALLPEVAALDIRTSPEGASLRIDVENLGALGTAPRHLAVTPGPHRVFASLEGFHTASAEVHAVLGQVLPVEIELVAMTGVVELTSSPAGAMVVDRATGQPLGQTPFVGELPIGDLALQVMAEGFESQSVDVSVRSGETSRVTIDLPRRPGTTAVLSVVADPEGAQVSLDGDFLGHAPLTQADIPPGRGRLEVRAPGFEPWSEEVFFEAGGATRAEVTLRDLQDRRWSRLRWIAYGLGAAALGSSVGFGVAALVNRNRFFESENPTRAHLDLVRTEALTADVLLGVGLVTVSMTLVFDLILGLRRHSEGTVTLDR